MRINTKRFLSGKVLFLVGVFIFHFSFFTRLNAQIINTIAGNGATGFSGDGGPAIDAELNLAYGVVVNNSGEVFIAAWGNDRVRKIYTSGIINTIIGDSAGGYTGDGGPATVAGLDGPISVALDKSGNIYISDEYNNVIRKVNTSGIINTIAGNGYLAGYNSGGYSGDGGPATAAELYYPFGVAVDDSGNVYFADYENERIRKVNTSGIISTIAGNGITGFAGDGGPATDAELYRPYGVAADDSGNLYIGDSGNNRVRKVNTSGIISTYAGGGTSILGDGGSATSAELSSPFGLAIDSIGNIYMADFNNQRIREVNTSGIINTVAGGGNGGLGDGGLATAAKLFNPYDVAVDAHGNLFIADTYNNRIRKVTYAFYVIAIVTNATCDGANNGTATAMAGSGTEPYTYSWSPAGGSDSIATGLSVGSYTVTVTDNQDSVVSAVVTITQPVQLSAFSVITNGGCNGSNNAIDSVSVAGGTSPYIYSWSNGETTVSSTGLSAGTYSVIVYDSCGSSATASVTITQPPVFIMPYIVGNITCNGENTGGIVLNPIGGTAPYTYFLIGYYDIYSTSSPFGFAELSPGTYTVIVTNSSGCVDSVNFTITQPPALSISANILSNVNCISVNTGSITITASGGTPPYTYLWSDASSQTTAIATGLSAGTYTVTVSDSCGSSVTESVVMGLSVSASARLNVSCNGGNNGSAFASISGGASPYTYQWNDPGSQTTATATGLSAGTYTVIVADSCANSATASVTVTQPAVLTVSATIITNVSCNGGENGSDSVSLSGGTSPYTYLWSDANSQTTATATGLSLGTYTVTVSDSCGSSATASAIMGLSVSASTLANLRCNGSNNGSVFANTSGGASPFTYLWSDADSQTTATANNLSAGTFTILVTDACGISATTSATVTQPPLLTIFPIITSDLHCNGDNTGSVYASASGGIQPYTFTWQWTSIINGEQTVRSNTLTGLSAGTYYVYLEDNTGCYAGRDTVVITQPTAITGTTTILTSITNCNGGNAGSISVFTTGGVPPYTYQWSDANSQTTITATGLSAGNYSVTITDNTGCTSFASNTFTLPNTLSDSVKVISNVGCNGGNTGSATVIVPGSRTVVQNYFFDSAVQHFSVPPGINTISINIGGASGGKLDSNFGGNGASFSGLCTVIPGDILSVVVGQEGGSNGGGGASWVYDSNVVLYNPVGTTGLLAVAAGGGGGCIERGAGGRNYYYYFGVPGGTNLVLNSATYGSYESANGGISGNGGAASLGGGGAGWLSNGQNRFYTDSGGRDEANHFVAVYLGSAYGGFGGGGPNGIHSGMGLENNGGGGGGYNGGGSGSGGGGGGSYFINTSPIVTANDTGNGFVTISYSVGAGIPPFTYLWSNGETTATATGLSAGVYTVTVEDTTGCSITAAVTITQAPAPSLSTFALSSITCFGGNNGSDSVYVSGGVSPYTYLWNDANSQTSITATGLSAGSYIVNVRDSIGCSSSTAVTITQPQLLTVNATLVSNVNCPGRTDGSVSCQASGGTAPYTYSWTGGGYDSLNYNLSVGTYTVLVTDNNGCTASDSISVSQTPNMHDTAIIVNVSCYGDSNGSITLMLSGGIAPFAFSWSQGATTSAITGLTAGSYSVGISDGCSVENFLYINISQPPPLSITADSINATSGNCNGSAWAVVSGGTNPYTYLWTGGLTTDTIANQCADYYCCTITDANGCIDSACVNIDASTGTNEVKGESEKVKVYPNPNNGVFAIALSHSELVSESQTIEIYNVLGEKVLTETLRHAQGDNLIDLKGQPNGMYFYRVINQDGSLIGEGKVVVEK